MVFFFKIEVQLLYNAVLVPDVYKVNVCVHIHTATLYHHRSLRRVPCAVIQWGLISYLSD